MQRLFSASLVVKSSAKQLNRFIRLSGPKPGEDSYFVKPDGGASKKQLEGNNWAAAEIERLSQSDDLIPELSCSYIVNPKLKVFYCFDLYSEKTKVFTELKMPSTGSAIAEIPDEVAEQFYFERSLCQVAYYQAMMMLQPNTHVWQAAFVAGARRSVHLDPPRLKYQLNFGGEIFDVKVTNAYEVERFYRTKLKASFTYESAARFDDSWKYEDFTWIHKFIEY